MPDIFFGRIKNSTNEIINVYGPRRDNDDGDWDNSGYVLLPGQITPIGWDCDGFLLPNDRYFISPEGEGRGPIKGPAAVKYQDLKSVEILKEGNNYKCVGAIDDGIFRAGEINWCIVDVNAAHFQNPLPSIYYVPS